MDPNLVASAGTSLRSLGYMSLAKRALSEQELHALLVQAQRANSMNALTGVLLYANGVFLQVLEGPSSSVSATFDRVLRDPRHRDVTTLFNEPIAERDFAQWSMGFGRAGPAAVRDIQAEDRHGRRGMLRDFWNANLKEPSPVDGAALPPG